MSTLLEPETEGLVALVVVLSLAALCLLWRYLVARARQRQALQAVAEQQARLSAIHKVATALSEAVELPELLGQGLERAVKALGLDGGQIHLVSADEDQVMRLSHVFGRDSHLWLDEKTIRVGECICGQAAADGNPVVVDDLASDPRVTRPTCALGGVPSVASVPLRAKGGSLGVLTVRSCDPHHFALHDVELLSAIASFMAAAIENARIRSEMQDKIVELAAEVQQLAIVQERERLGREMHDGLAQTLGLLNLQIEMVKVAAQTGDWEAAETELARLDAYLSNAYADVREALSNLRRTAVQGESFIQSLEDYVADFGQRYNLEAVLVASNGGSAICLPPLVEVQLQRVIQEALANVRRHAQASRVQVQLEQGDGGWRVAVVDDGIGFDLQQVGQDQEHSFGLVTMKERVQSVGGQLEVDSRPGQGTRVTAFVPCGVDGQGA